MFRKPESNPDFPALEREVLQFWRTHETFKKQVAQGDQGDFVFYDGPPFATGTPHYGHLLAGTIKDIVPRYQAMRGFRVERRFGWDTHGLPVEMEIEKDLGLNSPSEVRAYGVGRYNEACRSIVLRYVDLWRSTVERMGRWVDFDNDYKTMNPEFMESVWWVFRQLWEKKLIYRGHKVMPYSWRLGTPLSNFEAGMDYRKVQDPAVTVRFPIIGQPGTSLLAWTTTPWTLPSNMGLCVGPEIDYVVAVRPDSAERLILAQALAEKVLGPHTVIEVKKGSELVGLRYTPLFDCFAEAAEDGAFRVVSDGYVSVEDGTGIVHQAPAFGEDDHRVAQQWGLPLRDAVDNEGKFTGDVAGIAEGQIVGLFVKDADKLLIADLKLRGLLFHQATIDHDYPFCWRSGTPLIYKAMPTWFVRVESVAPGSTDEPLRVKMARNNQKTRWVPEYVGQKRFANWISDARDWAISRNRFWGTPLPIWQCDGCGAFECVGSIAELQGKSGVDVHDLHKHHVDGLKWNCAACGGTLERIPEVLDCWFESGAMPYAQNHYPFENKEMVEANLPAAFIAEGLDQTRGWFYTLLVLSTALFDRPAFQNVIVNGLILAEDGQKMSKRLKNYPDPNAILESYGADALRAYLVTSPAVRAEPMRFAEAGVREVVRSVVLPLWNAYSFFATYAVADGWAPPEQASPVADRALLDRWVLSRLNTVIGSVNGKMQQYRLYEVIPEVLELIDDLTNWYIRRSRRRFWKSENDRDKQHAFETLYEVLTTFARVLAPILPFLAETLYQRLEGWQTTSRGSVHLERFPDADATIADSALEAQMAVARQVVPLARNLREQHKLRVRQPLPLLTILQPPGAADWPELVRDVLDGIIRDELNVKAVAWTSEHATLVTFSAKPNFKVLGQRLGARMKEVAAAASALTPEQTATLRDGGTLTLAGEALNQGDFLFTSQPRPGAIVATEGTITVALDTAISDELRMEGLALEVVSKVQTARKDAGLEVEDRIALGLWGGESLRAAVEANRAYITAETLTTALYWLDAPGDLPVTDVVGEPLALLVRKA